MNIKSNKDEKPFLKSAWIGAKEVGSDLANAISPLWAKILISIVMFGGSYYAWEYSGMLSLWLISINFLILFEGNHQSPSVGEKIAIGIVITILVMIMGTNNVYSNESRIIPVEFSKVVYTDSTEKTVIYMTSPIKKAVVVNFGASEYYMMKELDQNLTIQIVENGKYTHWDKLENQGAIDEYSYELVVVSPDQNFTHSGWSKKKDGERQFAEK